MTKSFSELVNLIWSAADLVRGGYKQSDYGKVILPFTGHYFDIEIKFLRKNDKNHMDSALGTQVRRALALVLALLRERLLQSGSAFKCSPQELSSRGVVVLRSSAACSCANSKS